MVAVFFVVGLVLLVVGAELLVRGASRLAATFGMSPLVIGLTVVAFGTSAPELAVSVQGAFTGNADVALGNVVGSNIANILLILGIAALIVPLTVDQQLVRWDVPLLIGVSFVVWLMGFFDGKIGRVDGVLLVIAAAAYTVFAVKLSKREPKAVQDEYEAALHDVEGAGDEKGRPPRPAVNVLIVIAGLVLLVGGAKLLVDAATTIATWLGLSQLVIGLTVIAVGTSLPEIATSIMAGMRGQRDIAVGNAVGSNLMNLLLVLGLTAAIAPGGIAVPDVALRFDLPVMIAVAIAALPIFFTGHLIARWEGALFLALYVAYTAYLVLQAQGHAWATHLEGAMLSFVLPILTVTLAVFAFREWRQRRAA